MHQQTRKTDSKHVNASSSSSLVEGCGDHLGKVTPAAETKVGTDSRPAQDAIPRSAGRWETVLYGAAFAVTMAYMARDFYLTFGRQPQLELSSERLQPGWLADWMEASTIPLEWEMVSGYKFFIVACLGFLPISQLTIRLAPRWAHYLAEAGYTIAVTVALIGTRKAVYLLCLHCASIFLSYYSLPSVWALGVAAMHLQNSEFRIPFLSSEVFSSDGYIPSMYFPIAGYLFCRSISAGHSLNRMLMQQRQEAADEAPSLLRFLRLHLPRALAYGFYLPWHFVGPILTFPEFCREAEKADRLVWDRKLVLLLLWRAARLLLWLLLLQVLHHFMPVGAFLHSIESYSSVPYSRLVFAMYLHGQNFMLVYVQLYGWPGLVARIDGLELPHWPDCISRVYTYRQMWRVFDRGLASFMHNHIYIPMGGNRHGILRQVAAVAASFAFVSIYHGDSYSVRIWAGLNALHLLLEISACAVYQARLKAWLSLHLSPKNHQRLVAYIIGHNLAITSCFIFVFLMNDSAALLIMVEIFKPLLGYRSWWHILLAIGLPYFLVQMSRRYEDCAGCKRKKHD